MYILYKAHLFSPDAYTCHPYIHSIFPKWFFHLSLYKQTDNKTSMIITTCTCACSKGYALACHIHDPIFPLVTSHTISIQTDRQFLFSTHYIQIHCLYKMITHVPVGEGVTTYRNKSGSLSTTHALHPHSIFTPSHLTHEIFVRPMSWMDLAPRGQLPRNQLPQNQLPGSQLPTRSTPIWSTSHENNSQNLLLLRKALNY